MRTASLVSSFATALLASSVVGCGTAPDSLDPAALEASTAVRALTGRDSATFVLARAEAQVSEPIVTLDLACSGMRVQLTLRDTITLWADGRVRMATVVARLHDGALAETSHGVATGSWKTSTRRDVYYYSDAPSVVATVAYRGQSPVQLWLRTAGTSAVSRLAPMGGSCGTGSDGREAEWIYTRR